MRQSRVLPAALIAVLGLTAACDEGTTVTPEEGLADEDLALVALGGDEAAGGIMFLQIFGGAESGPSAVAAAEEREFNRSRPCPAGGSIELSGIYNRTQNGEGTVEATLEGTRTQVECTRMREDVTLVVDGTGSFAAYRKRVNGEPVGNQTSSYEGTFDWTRTRGDETRSGSCSYQLDSVRNPDSGKVRVTGMICDREIDREREWHHGT